ncbi:MAG: glycoside hydrolase family 9 protein [Oscillospiraceae bacterium]|nr:glycoside hydrolase family 9 protein [Oscillospiraceae bacterium]
MKKTAFGRRLLASLASMAVLLTSALPVTAADADPEEKIFPETVEPVDVNFAKALQLSLYFYDANKCGCGITGGNLEWRGDCHTEDAKVPLIPMTAQKKGTNLSQEFIDAHKEILDPDGDGTIDVAGGMHDAGDCVKFCLPGSYAASTLGWGYYEFRDAYIDAGQQWHVEDILHWFNDYYLKCLYYDENGDVLAFCYQVGEGNIDHNYWLTPELQNENLLDFARPAYFATEETPASDMCAGVAASLAVSYLNFKDTEPEYAQECLTGALKLYEFAVKTHTEGTKTQEQKDKEKQNTDPTEENPDEINKDRENTDLTVTSLGYDGGFYTSSYDYDELAWAAVWLYECTGKWDYIDDIIHVDETVTGDMGAHPYTGYLKRIIKDTGNCWQNIWVHCWDTVWGGVFAKLAPITNCSRDWYIFRWNLEFWSGMTPEDAAKATGLPAAVTAHKNFGTDDAVWNTTITADKIKDLPETDGAWLKKTPAGFSMLNDYGSARYDTAAQLEALVYAKETGDMTFADWSKGQMEYIMGNNPMNRSYIVGYDLEKGASHPHHRAAHGSTTLNMDDPVDQTHVLWGALVGGPDADDWHRDLTKDYIYNEVAVDYNAGFVGACAGLYQYYGKANGDQPEENFPPSEESMKGEITEFTLKAAVGQEDNMATQILIEIANLSSQPPRYLDDVRVRYYFNISELLKNGQTLDNIEIRPDYDEMKSSTDGKHVVDYNLVQYNDNGDCYLELTWENYQFYGDLQVQFALMDTTQNADYKFVWDSSNDYSRKAIRTADEIGKELNEAPEFTDGITMYIDQQLVWGTPPEGSEETPVSDTLWGDADCNGIVNILDVITLNKAILGKESLTAQGKINADVDQDNTPDSTDSLNILKLIVGIMKAADFPIK